VNAGLNKGEARRAVFFNRLGELRDRSFEQRRYRASGFRLEKMKLIRLNIQFITGCF